MLFVTCFEGINAQHFQLNIFTKDSLNTSILKRIPYKKEHLNQQSAATEINNISKKLAKIGYFNNTYNIKEKDSIINCTYTLNKKFDFIRVYYNSTFDNKILDNLKNIKVKETYFEVAINQIEPTLNSIINFYEASGFSFTSIYLNNIKENNHLLIADLIIEPSKKRQITNVIIKGYPNFPRKFLNYFVKIKKNTVFNTKTLKLISDRLNQLPFITQIKKPAVLFHKDSTSVFLYLKKKSNNNFDGIIGFANQPSSNKIQFNGYVDLNLNNIFNNGENLKLNWKSFQKSSKSLNVQFNAPYIFNTPITSNFEFSIFKQDSTYLNSKTAVQLAYPINQNTNFTIIYNGEKSNLTASPITNNNLTDFNNNYYGASYSYFKRNTSNNFHPFKFLIETQFLIGNRKISATKEQQTKLNIKGTYLINFNTKNSVLFKSENALLNSNNYYQNELYRIGGINTIRGFDEQSLFTSKYTISSIEYYYTLNENNALYTITDIAFLKDIFSNTTQKLYSIGFGLYFKTEKSIINISYALGKTDRIPFDFRDSKFHLRISYPF
jgi:hemolysin activation/secretion protein